MKRLIQIIFFLILSGFIAGYYIKLQENAIMGDRIIGICVLASAFILIPLFIYHRAKGKKMSDYMLTKDNLEKMNKKDKKNTDNQ